MSQASSFQRLSHALRDHGRIVVNCERHDALKSMRARHEDAEPAAEGGWADPRFMRATRVSAACEHGRLDALAAVTWDAFHVEDRERHTA